MTTRGRRAMLAIEGVTKSYGSGDIAVQALRGIDLRIDRGDFVAIMGASGSGKSTLMNVVGCLDVPTTGSYLLEGIDVGKLDDFQLAFIRNRRIGFVFQSFNLLAELTALENVLLPDYFGNGVPDAERRARDGLARVGLADKASSRPTALSGGERQRVAIARAFLAEAPILVLDEATSALDSDSEETVRQALDRLMHSRTVIAIAHRLSSLRNFDRIIVLQAGQICEDGPPQVLGRRDSVYRNLVRQEVARLEKHAA